MTCAHWRRSILGQPQSHGEFFDVDKCPSKGQSQLSSDEIMQSTISTTPARHGYRGRSQDSPSLAHDEAMSSFAGHCDGNYFSNDKNKEKASTKEETGG